MTICTRRYVEWLTEPVGDFADKGPGFYVLEDRDDGTYGLIVAGPFEDEDEAYCVECHAEPIPDNDSEICPACYRDHYSPEAHQRAADEATHYDLYGPGASNPRLSP